MDVMDKELKVPKLRFKDDGGREFPSWEERRLGEYLQEKNIKEVESSLAPLMAFVANRGIVYKGERYDRSALIKEADKQYKRTDYGDFIYSSNNLDVGSIGLNLYGSAVISPVYEIFSAKVDVNLLCISTLIQRPKNLYQILRYRQGVMYGQLKIHSKDFLNVKLFLPTLPEQRKIADFLTAYDELIDTQSKRVEALKLRKKGLLQKIFSQEIRFKDDEGREFPKWKEKTIREISMLVTKQTGFDYTNVIKSSLVTSPNDDTLPYLQTKNFSGLHFNYKTDYYISRKYGQIYPKLFLNEPCLLMSIVGASVGNIGLFSGETHCFLSGAICVIRLSPGENINYVYQYMIASRFQQEVKLNTKTGAQATITIEDIRSLSIKYPTLPEQRKIADFLSVADYQIALEGKRLDTMCLIKKALLQQLFV